MAFCIPRLALPKNICLELMRILSFFRLDTLNKGQANALESILLGGAKKILGCSSRTCNEAVKGDMGLDSLKSRRD